MFLEVAEGLAQAGHDIRVVTSKVENGEDTLEYKGIDIYYYRWKSFLGHPIPKVEDLNEHVKWADVVHTAVYTVAPVALRAGRKWNKPVLTTVYEALGDKWYWVEKSRIKAFALKLFEKTVIERPYTCLQAISNATKQDMENYHLKAKTEMIYCPVDETEMVMGNATFDEVFGLPENGIEKRFLYYGRPGQTKGVFVYLDAIKCLADSDAAGNLADQAKFCFVLADEPHEQREYFMEEVKKGGLEKLVYVARSRTREDLNALIQKADYIVVPSITEGFGYSAIEACGFDKKLICSTAGSLPEVVYGKCLFFENRNAEDLKDKLVSVLDGTAQFCNLEPKDFSRNEIVRQFVALYQRISGRGAEEC